MLIRDRIREFKRVKASELEPNPKNWRTHPAGQQDALRGALSEIGYASALLAYEPTPGRLRLIDGHLRAETTPDTEVPVLVLDVNDQEADKLLATFDPLTNLAGLDDAKLRELAAAADIQNEAMLAMLNELIPAPPVDGLTDADHVPEPPETPITQPGDLWVMGNHRLLCGDATNADDVHRVLDGAKPLLMVTDPPYGVNYDPSWRAAVGINKNTARMGKVQNDDRADWTEAWALFPGEVVYVWHGALHSSDVARSIIACDFEIRGQIIWKKSRFALSRGAYHWGHEPAWYAVRKGHKASWTGDRKQSTVWDLALAGGDGDSAKGLGHGTQKPVECMERPIRHHGTKGDAVYEPFCGSGTTIIAAERQERACYAIEIDPVYVDVAVQRWKEYTGQDAVREEAPCSE